MSDFNKYKDDEDPFLYDEDSLENYNREYMSAMERETQGLPDSEKDALIGELNLKHNLRRSTDGASDARRNVLESRESLQQTDGTRDPHVQKYMQQIDRREGRPGAGKEALRKALKMELPMGLRGKI